MKKQINDLLLKMQSGENCIGETANQLLVLFDLVGRSEQLKCGLTCMMCRKPKDNDGHTCCEECAGLAF